MRIFFVTLICMLSVGGALAQDSCTPDYWDALEARLNAERSKWRKDFITTYADIDIADLRIKLTKAGNNAFLEMIQKQIEYRGKLALICFK